MAINIQEILHPSDSDSIKFSKINYNFDQLVVNGGGPEGPKGDIGFKGETGNTGAVGPQGNKGDKGQSGETTSPWKSIAIDLDPGDNRDNLTILKPKPDTDKATPVIWIGDSSFFNVNSDGNAFDGDTTLRSSLNVGRHYNLSSGQVEAEYMTFWHNANKKLKIDSEDVQGTATVRWNITPAQPIVGNPEDIRLHINTHTVLTEPFKLNNFAPVNSPIVEEPGMIRYNAGGNKFEGYISGQWKAFCMDSGAGCGSGGGGSISISGGNLNLNVDGTEVGSAPTFNFSDWNGSISVDAAGTVSITNGNGLNVTTDPVSVSQNNTAGVNPLSFLVDVEVPSGYSNVGQIVQDNVSVSQPTSYVAPSADTFTLNLNEGNSGSSWNVASATLIVGNSNGATQNSFNLTSGGGTLSVDALPNTIIQIELLSSAGSNLAFTADPLSITGSQGVAYTIVSQALSNNDEDAQLIFNVTLPGSGGTTNFTFEATTVSTQVSGTYNYWYGSTSSGACDSQSGFYGGGVTGQSVTWNTGATNADKLSAAQTAAGYHHASSLQYSGNGWISIQGIFENGVGIGLFADEVVQIGSGGGWVNAPSQCSLSGGQGPQGKQGNNPTPNYAPAAISYVTNPVTVSPHQVVEFSPIDVVVTTSNFANTPTLAYTVSSSSYFTVVQTGNSFNVAYQGQNQTQSGWIEITATGNDNGGNNVTVSTGQIALQGIAFQGNNYSDRRLKNNINLIGTSDSGINIYTFEYKDCRYGCGLFEGVMSDEVPAEAVSVDSEGYDMVNYDLIDVEFKQIEDYSLYEGRGEV